MTDAQTFTTRFRKKPAAAPAPSFVYLATDTAKGVAKGIYVSRFSSATGQLTEPVLVAETLRPSFLAISASVAGHRRLYAANEGNDAASSTISSFLMDAATGALQPINKVSAAAAGPAYLSLDATGEAAFVADYAGSTVASYRVLPGGGLSDPVEHIDYRNAKFGRRGPMASRQDAPHPHSVHISPDNRFLVVSDLGSDAISVFAIQPGARLGAPAIFVNDRAGCGPRHVAFHPNGRWLYSINELDSTIDHFLWTTTSSRTNPTASLVNTGQFVKTTAQGFPAGKNTAAEVAISPDGNFVYASNRGEDSLVVFSIAEADGKLTFVQRIPCGGKTPRQFTLSPDSRWLVCGNQDGANVTVFRRDGSTGKLAGPVETLGLDSVMFVMFA